MPRRTDRQALVMALFLVGLTGFAVLDRLSEPVESIAGAVLEPLQGPLYRVAAGAGVAVTNIRDVGRLQRRVKELEDQNSELVVRDLKTRNLMLENDMFRQLLDYKRDRVDLDLRAASVVGRAVAEEPGSLMRSIKIDIGSRDGAQVGMPVATDRGLVGRIARAGTRWSDVLLVTDPSSAVRARIERSRETGVVFGTTAGELRLRYVPQDIDGEPNVKVGDVVFTSGLSQEFPAMLAIGQVVSVEQRDVETHQEAVIHPTVDFSALEFVLVVVDHEPLE